MGLSTDAAVGMARKFLRNIAQPLSQAQRNGQAMNTKGKDSWTLAELTAFQEEQQGRKGEGHEGREDAMQHDYMHSAVNGVEAGGLMYPLMNGKGKGKEKASNMDEFEDGIEDDDLMMAMDE